MTCVYLGINLKESVKMKKWFVVTIEFESLKYNEEGILTYKVRAESQEEARLKVEKYIGEERKKDKNYNEVISSIIEFNSLTEIF